MNIKDIQDGAKGLKPPTYDHTIAAIRAHYYKQEGDTLRAALATRFPKTHQSVQPFPVGFIPHVAATDAAVYDNPPKRSLTVGGIVVDPDDPRQAALDHLVEDMSLDAILTEVEAITCVAGTVFLRVSWLAHEGRPFLQWAWPSDVAVYPAENFTGYVTPETIKGLVYNIRAETHTDNKALAVWETWHQEEGGLWVCTKYNQDKQVVGTPTKHKTLPWISVHKGLTNGGAYYPADTNLVAQATALSVNMTNLVYLLEQQSHSDLVYKGNNVPNFTVGASAVVPIGKDESLEVLTHTPHLEEGVSVMTSATKTLGLMYGHPADSYNADNTAALSGVSRMLANAPHIKATTKRAIIFGAMERAYLWPTILRVVAESAPASVLAAPTLGVSVAYDMAVVMETPAEKQERVLGLLNAGLLTREAAAVMLGLARDITEAGAILPAVDPNNPLGV